MTIEERAELAVETFAAGKGNCTQSVLCAWEDKIPVDHDTLMKLGAGYGAGMGCMQATCGALIGAVMAAGSVTDGKGTPRTARSILTSFQEKSGATICKDLKGRGDRQGPLSMRAVRPQRRPRRRRDAGGVKGEKPSSLRALSKK